MLAGDVIPPVLADICFACGWWYPVLNGGGSCLFLNLFFPMQMRTKRTKPIRSRPPTPAPTPIPALAPVLKPLAGSSAHGSPSAKTWLIMTDTVAVADAVWATAEIIEFDTAEGTGTIVESML